MYYPSRDKIGRYAKHSRSLLGRILSYPFRIIWQAFKALKWQRKALLCFIMVLAAIPFGGKTWEAIKPSELVYKRVFADEIDNYKNLPKDRLEAKIGALRADLLDTLQKCESGGKDTLAIVFDTNGVASVGVFQWQPHSFIHYWQKMTGEKITEREAIVKALDNETARELAAYTIFENDHELKPWHNCTKWHKLNEKLENIKYLES